MQTRTRPSVGAGLAVYAGYLAIFFVVWVINDVDYMHLGETVDSAKRHYAIPTLLGSLFVAVVVTAKGWWRPLLFDDQGSGPGWAWVGPAALFVLGVLGFSTLHPDKVTGPLVLWSVLGGLGVGFGEEMITRGALLVGLRSRYTEEQAWLFSTLAFSALHIPNLFFGVPPAAVPIQFVMTFIVGSLLWATRRMSRTLLLPMFLHGFWDSSIFLPRATGSTGSPLQALIYPIAIVCAIVVVRRNRGLRIG